MALAARHGNEPYRLYANNVSQEATLQSAKNLGAAFGEHKVGGLL
jgi:hypothetical protein